MNHKRESVIKVLYGENDCPADALMNAYRKNDKDLKKKVYYTKSSIDFFKSMCDGYEQNGRISTFYWEPIIEEDLPSLKVKVEKKKKDYELIYLKEKVTFTERKNEFHGKVTLNINQSKLKKTREKGMTKIQKEEREEK